MAITQADVRQAADHVRLDQSYVELLFQYARSQEDIAQVWNGHIVPELKQCLRVLLAPINRLEETKYLSSDDIDGMYSGTQSLDTIARYALEHCMTTHALVNPVEAPMRHTRAEYASMIRKRYHLDGQGHVVDPNEADAATVARRGAPGGSTQGADVPFHVKIDGEVVGGDRSVTINKELSDAVRQAIRHDSGVEEISYAVMINGLMAAYLRGSHTVETNPQIGHVVRVATGMNELEGIATQLDRIEQRVENDGVLHRKGLRRIEDRMQLLPQMMYGIETMLSALVSERFYGTTSKSMILANEEHYLDDVEGKGDGEGKTLGQLRDRIVAMSRKGFTRQFGK